MNIFSRAIFGAFTANYFNKLTDGKLNSTLYQEEYRELQDAVKAKFKLLGVDISNAIEQEELEIALERIDNIQELIHQGNERHIERQMERDILDEAKAENTRLRILFGLEDENITEAIN